MPFLFPVLLWLLFGLLRLFAKGVPLPHSSFCDLLFVYFVSSMLVGGLPYCLFVVGVVLWSRGRTADELRRATWLLPLIFVPVCGISLYCLNLLHGAMVSFANFYNSARIGLYAIPFGYFYICLVTVLTYVLQKTGWLAD
jgi:hypothetical protein